MNPTFARDGVRFQYPGNWPLDVDVPADDAAHGQAGWAATVQSQATAFALVSLRPDADTPAVLATETFAALQAEYPDIEAEERIDTLAGLPAVGHDFDFLTVDMAVNGWTRCIDTPAGPLLVLCQVGEYDRDANEPVLRAVCASLRVDEE